MQIAWDSLRAGSSSRDEDIAVITTHYYVKFSPQNENKLEIIKDDTTLTLYDSPLDYEIDSIGAYYHDPDVPLHKPTPQYCAVEANYIFPNNVKYEILEELFIPDDYSDNNSGRLASSSLIKELVNTSLRLTGNLDSDNKNNDANNGRVAMANWRPAGRIMVWDDNIGVSSVPKRVVDYYECYDCETDVRVTCHINENARISQCRRPIYQTIYIDVDGSNVPVAGLMIRARRWFTTHEDYTNTDGTFSCNGTFDGEANYSFKWERYQFSIRDGFLSTAKYDGPKKRGDWHVNFNTKIQKYYASIFRAARHYYYLDIKGLRRPPQNDAFSSQMKFRAHDKTNDDDNGNHWQARRFFGIDSQINMYNPNRKSMELYATAIHELAHASHWYMHRDGRDFQDTNVKVSESWARGVEWDLTRMVYSNDESGYLGRSRQINDYTLVVADMLDRGAIEATRINYGYINSDNVDFVENYTIRQIEDALKGKLTWDDWRLSIFNMFDNNTGNNLELLFDAYE